MWHCGRLGIRSAHGLRVGASILSRLLAARLPGPIAKLKSEIDFRGNLDFFARMIETEQIDFDDPRARRHPIEVERSGIVRDCEENAIALRRFDGRARDGLAFGFDLSVLSVRQNGEHADA